MEITEMLGLPASGKSFVINSGGSQLGKISNNYTVHFVEKGMNVTKIKNIVYGLVVLLFQQPLVFIASFVNKNNYKKILLLCERVGRTSKLNNALLDEGITQACWAVLLNGKGKYRLQLVKNMVASISKKQSAIFYVSANKKTILSRAQQRLKESPKNSYDYRSEEYYAQARDAMACLLIELRKERVVLQLIRN